MRKLAALFLCLALVMSFMAVGAAAEETKTGMAKGFGGELTVEVTVDGDVITGVTVTQNSETQGIGSNAVEQLPAAIVAAGNTEVDGVAGATVSSDAIKAAVLNALDPENNPYEAPVAQETVPVELAASDAYLGFGVANNGRVGPGKDDTDTQVYSFNSVYAQVIFDADGKILLCNVDELEVATPNYDGATMPHFSGFPGQGGYNLWNDETQKVDGKTEDTEETFQTEIAGWQTKRQRGEGYQLSSGTWTSEMNKFQEVFVGKTVDEVEAWFAAYCSDVNGRPLTAESSKEGDAEKYAALTEEEKAMLVDVTSGATMSLKDGHGDILAAVRAAYENRQPVSLEGVAGMGFGLSTSGRVGPGKDDTDTQVYSINEVLATTLVDAQGKILTLYVDQLEVATPNYDGAGMPHFGGFPGQGGYNLWDDEAQKVNGKTEDTDDTFLAEVSGWQTKRERGESYQLSSGTWTSEMNKFQEVFAGKTADEISAWFAAYCSDANGRPLTVESSKEGDAEKYAALSEDDKAMLADVTSGATMSLKDGHGDILAAIAASVNNLVEITVK
ncbi:MAG: FMN-binding protein [Eubacteriales bacterium]|nr:FMN-binding protein [Eubacteriales bacterium]